jgi:O-antigen/teichoic acid export membrane protein
VSLPETGRPAEGSRVRGSRHAALALADQAVSSASNFALGVVVARLGGTAALGAFGVVFLCWLAALGTQRALVSEPMTVGGGPSVSRRERGEGLAASLVLGVGVALVLALAAGVAGVAGVDPSTLLFLLPWLPGLLAQDYCRAVAFRLQRPDWALAGDVAFLVVQAAAVAAFLVTGTRGLAAVLAAWGIGAIAGAAVGAVLAGIPLVGGGLVRLRALWPRSRWFLAEFATAFPADQGYLLLLPVLLGTAQFGVYRAGASLVGPVVVLFVAGGNVGLPAGVRRLHDGGLAGLRAFAPRLTGVVVAATVLYCGTVAVFAEPLLRVAFGEGFAAAAPLTAFVAVQYVLFSLSFGWGVAVKAADQMRRLWMVRIVSATTAVVAVVALTSWAQLTGAGVAAVVAGAAYSVAVGVAYRRTTAGTTDGAA